MKKFIVTEVFGNTIQGEGKYMGKPSIFVRFFGCTLKCPGFSMPRGQHTHEVEEIVKTLNNYKDEDLKKLPLAKTGCDSYPAWHPACRRFSKEYEPDELSKIIKNLVPKEALICDYHIVFTGGEPLLYQELLPILMRYLCVYGFTNYTFETNGTVGLKPDIIKELNTLVKDYGIEITWSCSPKLSIAGYNSDKTLFPKFVKTFNKVKDSNLYFKYVIRDKQDLQEVEKFTEAYIYADVAWEETYLMPEGGTVCKETSLTEKEVANLCIQYGYRFSPRLHLALFGNKWGK